MHKSGCKAYWFIIMAHNSRYDVKLSSSFSYLNHNCSLLVRNVPKILKFAIPKVLWLWRAISWVLSAGANFFWLWNIHSRTIDFRSKFKNPRLANSMASPFRYDRKKIESAISPNYIIGDPNFFWSALDPFGTFRPPQKILILIFLFPLLLFQFFGS